MKIAIGVGAALCLLSSIAMAQQGGRKAFTLHGMVERVDASAKRLSVTNEPIPGGMGAMTMNYGVEKEEVLTRIKPGDRITARIYEGDSTLYDLQKVPEAPQPAATRSETPGLHLEELERIALENNPTLSQVQANLRVSAGLARQAGLYPNPTIGYLGDEVRGGYTGGGKQGAFISQTVVTGGKLRAARRVAQLMTQEAETAGEVQKLRILNNVRMVFYQVLADQRRVELRQKLAKLAADATQTSHQLANVGQADRPDVLQAEIEQQQAEVALRVAQQTVQSSWRILVAVAGKPDLPQRPLAGDLEAIPDLNYEQWLETTFRESPEVKLAGQAIERSEAALSQAKKVAIPDLQLYGSLAQNNEPLETTGKPIGLNGGVQIGVQLPIFNRNQGNVAAAKGGIESARQELSRLKLQIAREMASLFREYDSARTTLRQYKDEMLPRAQEAYKLYQANYQEMAAAYPQVLISQRTLFQLEAEYVQALENAWQSALQIRGFNLMDGLSAPVSSSGASLQFGSGGASPGGGSGAHGAVP